MRFAAPAAFAVALLAATPAFGTGGLLCKTTQGQPRVISLVIGHGIPSGVVGASLWEKGRWRSTFEPKEGLVVSQSWSDRQLFWVDIIRRDTGAPYAQLRLKRQGFAAAGTFTRGSRSLSVRCADD